MPVRRLYCGSREFGDLADCRPDSPYYAAFGKAFPDIGYGTKYLLRPLHGIGHGIVAHSLEHVREFPGSIRRGIADSPYGPGYVIKVFRTLKFRESLFKCLEYIGPFAASA